MGVGSLCWGCLGSRMPKGGVRASEPTLGPDPGVRAPHLVAAPPPAPPWGWVSGAGP